MKSFTPCCLPVFSDFPIVCNSIQGPAPSIEEPQGPYPTMVKQPSGRQVPVVQAYAFGKYLGNLMVTFNDDGEVIATAGLPILMDKNVPQGMRMCFV